jgi:hypothetical protein
MAYCGFLLPQVPIIIGLARRGYKPKAISDILWEHEGVAATPAMVAYVLKDDKKSREAAAKVKTTVVTQDWQTWTPEMQEAEFQMGYSR